MTTVIERATDLSLLPLTDHLVVCGTRAGLKRGELLGLLPPEIGDVWASMVESLHPGDQVAMTSTWLARDPSLGAQALRVTVIALSDRASRHNAPGRPDALAAALRGRFGKGRGSIIIALDRVSDALAAGLAVARAFPIYAKKRRGPEAEDTRVLVHMTSPEGPVPEAEWQRIEIVSEAVREAGRLTDTPPSELTTDAFVEEALNTAARLGVAATVLRMDGLRERGMGGLVGVGQAAVCEPALVHLSWPGVADSSGAVLDKVAWVGKGIVYDTGGLSLKGKSDMPGMKVDMGGAAAVLMAFEAAVRLGVPRPIEAVLCLAENSVGPNAMRPDDIITLYSGKTVEVNNTDAEGRLVLADGVAYAGKDLGAKTIVDLATLTGAQLVATGKLHAAVISNDEALEDAAVAAGKRAGDLVFPLPFAPELFRGEFQSAVADLRNSVKDRMNAQSSCAAQFIAESLTPGVRWLHVDLAGPVTSRDRGTGFGVGLLLELLRQGA
ncbi:MAG: leucyl aminopeptidase family protein [Deltaproteobacteria bacterium]|nr:leucyl aminopeptidase family protein [Deltaproteobacteria bacterium]